MKDEVSVNVEEQYKKIVNERIKEYDEACNLAKKLVLFFVLAYFFTGFVGYISTETAGFCILIMTVLWGVIRLNIYNARNRLIVHLNTLYPEERKERVMNELKEGSE